MAQDDMEDSVLETSPHAVCFCLLGALCAVEAKHTHALSRHHAQKFLSEACNYDRITDYNDEPERTLEDIYKVIDTAIELAKQNEDPYECP